MSVGYEDDLDFTVSGDALLANHCFKHAETGVDDCTSTTVFVERMVELGRLAGLVCAGSSVEGNADALVFAYVIDEQVPFIDYVLPIRRH